MDSLPVEAVQQFLDYVEKPSDLVAFHRLSAAQSTAVTADYWRHRVSTLLGVPILPANVYWAVLYSKLVRIHGAKILPLLMEYQVPRSIILDWLAVSPTAIESEWITKFSRYDLVLDSARRNNPLLHEIITNLEVSDFGSDNPLWLQLQTLFHSISLYRGDSEIYRLFYILLQDPNCPLSVIIQVDFTYKLTALADYWLTSTDGQDHDNLVLCLKAAQGSKLTQVQALGRVIFILNQTTIYTSGIRFELSVFLPVSFIIRCDSPMILFLFTRLLDNERQLSIQKSLFYSLTYLKPKLAKLVAATLTPLHLSIALGNFLATPKYDLKPSSFYSGLFQHPLVTFDVLVTQIMPKLLPKITLSRSDEGWRQTIDNWNKWGITDTNIFLDPRTQPFIDGFYDVLYLLLSVPYSSNPQSKYFKLLLRLDKWKVPLKEDSTEDEVLARYITQQPQLGADKVLWRNLVKAGKYFLVTTLLRYSIYKLRPYRTLTGQERQYRAQLLQLNDPQTINEWIDK
jgi:hypothetical protein